MNPDVIDVRDAPSPDAPLTLAPAVVVGGWVRRPLRLDAAGLRRRGLQPARFQVVCTLDGPHGAPRPVLGVPLAQLLQEADPAFEVRTDFKRTAIVAESHEVYRALFSWNEVFNTAVGDGVLVLLDDPAAPLAAHHGPFALASLRDHHTGPRFVRQLAMVELVRLW